MQQNNVLAAIVAVAKKEPICYSVYPPEINEFRMKTFQAAQLTSVGLKAEVLRP